MKRRHFIAASLGIGLTGGCLRLQTGGTPATTAETTRQTPETANPQPTIQTDSPVAPPTETRETTETPDEATESTPQQPDYPPGVGEDGLNVLVGDAHTTELTDKTFTTRFRHEDLVEGVIKGDQTTAYADSTSLREYNARNGSKFSTGSESLWRKSTDIGTVYGYRPLQVIGVHAASWNDAIRNFIEAGRFETIETVDRDGGQRYRSVADGPIDDAATHLPYWIARKGDEVSEFKAEALLHPNGVFERLQVTVEVLNEDSIDQLRTTIETFDIGSTTVSTPDWIQTARDRRPKFEAALIDDRRFLRLDHTGGVAIPARVEIDIHGESAAVKNHIVNEERIQEGDRIWLWRDQEDAYMDRGSRPSVTPEPLDAEGWLEIQMGNSAGPCRWTVYRVDFAEL